MYVIPFSRFFPELAKGECRSLFVGRGMGVPPGGYALLESYCDDAWCDCSSVILTAVSMKAGHIEATILLDFDQERGTVEPTLHSLVRQGPYAERLLEFVTSAVLCDRDYVNRLKRHYTLVKTMVALRRRARADSTPARSDMARPVLAHG